MKLGAKTDFSDIELAKRLSTMFDFMEILYKPEVNKITSKILLINATWVVHSLHYPDVNLSKDNGSVDKVKKVIDFSELIGARKVIVHPGTANNKQEIETLLKNYKQVVDYARTKNVKILVENIMYHTVVDSSTCFGKNPAEIEKLMEATGCGFVLDFSHAQSSSLSFKRNFTNVLDEYLKLSPDMFHLCDGMTGQPRDMHLPLGKGTFNIKQLCSLIGDKPVTLEVSPPTLDSFKQSKEFIRSLGY